MSGEHTSWIEQNGGSGRHVSEVGTIFNQDFQNSYPIIRTIADAEAIPILDEVSDGLCYIGYASLGTATTDAGWKVIKMEKIGTVTTTYYADGDEKYDNIWDNRLALTYSR